MMNFEVVRTMMDVEVQEITQEQRTKMRDNYNTSFRMGCVFIEDERIVVFEMSTDSFKSFEYYMGMEYEREEIVARIECDGFVRVGYQDSERAERVYATVTGKQVGESDIYKTLESINEKYNVFDFIIDDEESAVEFYEALQNDYDNNEQTLVSDDDIEKVEAIIDSF